MNKDKILAEINETFSTLHGLISSFDDGQINVIPFEGSWTAGQLAKHVILSDSGFVQMLNGPVKDTERSPEAMAEKIKHDFLDFTNKMKSPGFVVPPQKNYQKEELSNALAEIREGVNKAMETLDLSKTCVAFELPVYGFLTRFEAICFVNYHTQRHVHQLKNIQQAVLEPGFVNNSK